MDINQPGPTEFTELSDTPDTYTASGGKSVTVKNTVDGLEFTTVAATPGGSDTQIQFNDSGSFGGDADLVWDKTNDRLGIKTSPTQSLDVNGNVRIYDQTASTGKTKFVVRAGAGNTTDGTENLFEITRASDNVFVMGFGIKNGIQPHITGNGSPFNWTGGFQVGGAVRVDDGQALSCASNRSQIILRTFGALATTNNASTVPFTVQGVASQSANLEQWEDSSENVLCAVAKNGAFKPASLADADAENNTIYYSTDASKLVYKDSGGTVNNLY